MKGSRVVRLRPVAPNNSPAWPAAVWVGEVDDTQTFFGSVELERGEGYAAGRLLVRHGRFVRGFVELPVEHGLLDGDELARQLAMLPPPATSPVQDTRPAITVIVCSRHRPEMLGEVLPKVLALDYPHFEVLVVDNGPDDPRSAQVIAAIDDPRLRRVVAPVPGLARARNVGLLAATHDLVAFTDDDVVPDRFWLQAIADGFGRSPQVACVSGIVPSAEIDTSAQWYFDSRYNWADSCAQDVFDVRQRRDGEPLFPFRVGRYGTGANFAVRREAMIALGGFDEGFGAGSPTGGGEDIDMFVRVLVAGYQLAYEPSAVIWHKHRAGDDDLRKQLADYGVGLGAWLTKLLIQPRTLGMILRRVVPAVLHLVRMTRVAPPSQVDALTHGFDDIGRIERRGILMGPLALLKARRAGARARPLARRRSAPAHSSEVVGIGPTGDVA